MKIGVFGGRFDPIHFGHLLLAESALRECELDRIIFVPTGVSPHKDNNNVVSGEYRIEMTNLAISGYEEYSSSRFEIDSKEISYTVNTLRHFKETMLDSELYLILGADMFNYLPHWCETAEICRLATPIVACRAGFPAPYFESLSQFVPHKRLETFHRFVVQMPQIELSSTQIRHRVAEGKSIRFQVPRSVEAYIHSYKLYRCED